MITQDISASTAIQEKAVLFLQTLRKATAAQHAQLESQPALAALLQQEVTIDQYTYYLYQMKQVVQVYEKYILATVGHLLPRYETKKSSILLTEDLNILHGLSWRDRDTPGYPLPPCDMAVSFALGFVYVMEGSKLGGKVIFHHMERRLGITANNGGKFITDDGAPTMQRWKALLSVISMYVVETESQEDAIAGASFAFRTISDFFSSQPEC